MVTEKRESQTEDYRQQYANKSERKVHKKQLLVKVYIKGRSPNLGKNLQRGKKSHEM